MNDSMVTISYKSKEQGQSIVLLTFALIALLILVGLAVDIGFGFVRSSQFSRAVDAAAKAGVFEIAPASTDTTPADAQALQFLSVNGWPTSTLVFSDSLIIRGRLGYPQYAFTATWPVETYFMRLLGIRGYQITRSATAGFYAQAEMLTPTQHKRGHLRQAGQFIIGDQGCTENGDPVSPLFDSRVPDVEVNSEYILFGGTHQYRIRIPSVYTETQSLVQIELFDPDTYNANFAGATVPISHTIVGGRLSGLPADGNCSLNNAELCIIPTGEDLDTRSHNPFWLARVDEIFNDSCAIDSDGSTTDETTFELYYIDENSDRQNIATYVSNPGNGASTDLKWVLPPGFTVPISTSLTIEDGARVIFLDVTSTGGPSRNVWDIWAGPPSSASVLDSDVNLRNLQIANDPTLAGQQSVAVLSLGRMPIQPLQNSGNMRLNLSPIDISFGGAAMYVSLFDFDPTPPFGVNFTIDSIDTDVFSMNGIVGGSPGEGDLPATCDGDTTSCNGVWTLPQWGMRIPGKEGRVVFFGGNLIATYAPGGDAHTISMSITDGRPFLTE